MIVLALILVVPIAIGVALLFELIGSFLSTAKYKPPKD